MLNSLSAEDMTKKRKWHILQLIAQYPHIPHSRLKKTYSPALLNTSLNWLENEGFIEIKQQLKKPTARRAYQEIVNLIKLSEDNYQAYYQRCKRSKAQQKVLDVLIEQKKSIPLHKLLNKLNISKRVLLSMKEKGLIQISQQPITFVHSITQPIKTKTIQLTHLQEKVIVRVYEGISRKEFYPVLLHGITGSGKTEIYILAIKRALEQGSKALLLTPEISLTPQLSKRFRSHFGSLVTVLHSGLSPRERLNEWWNIKEGRRKVVIGTRSAIFSPLDDVGIIIVDEEHDASYKQEENPRYNGRDLALMRGKIEQAEVILGSATPSLESFFNAEREKYLYLQLEERISPGRLPQVEIIDMQQEFKQQGKRKLFSQHLSTELQECLSRKEQALILLNRRGYASYLQCRKCGYIPTCLNCSISLTYHQTENRLKCHYCGYSSQPLMQCQECEGEYIHYIGEGTEKIEEKLSLLLPQAKILRMDRDTTRFKGAAEKIISQFTAGGANILIGTQMIAKGHDIHNVTLMGIISADVALTLPDFRSSERTFQLLTQASGRSGRGELRGKVIIQTNHPNHYSIQMAEKQDYHIFYQKELRFRRIMKYPPFTSLVNIILKGRNLKKLKIKADKVAQELQSQDTRGIWIIGPAPAPISKIKGNYRYQIILKARNRTRLKTILKETINNLRENRIGIKDIFIDIDPLSLM